MKIFWFILACALFAAAVALHLIACYRRMPKLRRITKPLLMPLLAAMYALIAQTPHAFVIVALLCGWLGDVFLLFTKRNIFMLLGMAAFALGHVFYIGAMLSTNPPLHLYVLILLLLAAAWVLFVVKKLLPTAPKSLRIPGLCYAVLLSGTALCALYLLFSTQRLCYLVSFVGGLLFMLSDTILTGQKYRKETRHGNFYVMLTYILAQMLLVGGFALNGGI